METKELKNGNPPYVDLIFEGRNKKYGAYQLRKKSVLFQAIGFVVSSALILLVFGTVWRRNVREASTQAGTIKVKHEKVVSYSQLSAPPPIEAIATPPPEKKTPKIVKQKVVATKKFLPPVVKPDEEVQDEEIVPTQEELKHVNPGIETKEGDSLGNVDFSAYDEAVIELDIDPNAPEVTVEPEPVEEPVAPPPPPPPPVENTVYDFVEKPPQYPGGQKELLNYLYKNLTYPEIARENGIEGTVVLKLIIEPDGSISEVEVLRKIGGGCEEEAIRVVKQMPKWEPGMQNERKVRVSVALPIKFELVNND